MGVFTIEIENIHWRETIDERDDLCAHGLARAKIGDELLEYNATVSATALYLLKTLAEDHIIYQDEQMLPCCGFNYITDANCENVAICGCPNGEDWTVLHVDEYVKLITASGKETILTLAEYRKEVFKFVDKVEAFYKESLPKRIPEDEFYKKGYLTFWKEWHRRRNGKNICQGKISPKEETSPAD